MTDERVQVDGAALLEHLRASEEAHHLAANKWEGEKRDRGHVFASGLGLACSYIEQEIKKAQRCRDIEPGPRGGEEGWVRVGRYDDARRRALWIRILPRDTDPLMLRSDAETIELCAGREGDDAYVKISRENPDFAGLLDCLLRAQDHIKEDK